MGKCMCAHTYVRAHILDVHVWFCTYMGIGTWKKNFGEGL